MNRLRRALLLAWTGVLSILGACGGDSTGPGAGNLIVTVSGLPQGAAAAVIVTGQGGFSRTLNSTATLTDLAPGSYTVAASGVQHAGVAFAPLEASQTLAVTRGADARVDVEYVNLASSLEVSISGLPEGVNGSVVLTGPDGFSATLTSSRLFPGLSPGTYTLEAKGVLTADSTYQSRPPIRTVSVSEDAPASTAVEYDAVGASTLNLLIDGLYLTQSVQTYDRSIPLVAGRDAFLRVFARADAENTATPTVRVRLYHGTALRETWTLAAGAGSVTQTVQQGTLSRSWNVLVPGSLIRPGAQLTAELDATDGVAEANEEDNRFPADGALLPLAVTAVPPARVLFVPVHQSVNGLGGGVTPANVEQFIDLTRRLHPVGEVEVAVREVYTTGAPELDPENSTGAWPTVLGELDALRVAEGTSWNYYGVVRTNYRSGFAGLAYVGGAAFGWQGSAIGWDFLPDAGEVVAHELGHNWSRRHAPCGGVGSSDPEYPYPGGAIGVHGYDVRSGRAYSPSTFDIMGYCDNPWISDYTYLGVMRHREAVEPLQTSMTVQPTLLVWGRMSQGELILEPAFHVDTRPVLPRMGSRYTLEGLDAAGARLFSMTFDGAEVADSPRGTRQFAFAVPITQWPLQDLAELRLSDGQRVAVQRRNSALQSSEVIRSSESSGEVRVQWDGTAFPMAMIRDFRSGRVLSFARGGEVTLPGAGGRELEAVLSDGVGNITRRMRNPGLPQVPE